MKIARILAVRNDRFGEFLLTLPALYALKEHYPGAELTLVVNGSVAELAARIPCVDEVIVWENKKHGFLEIGRFAAQTAGKKYDLCVIFNPSKELNIVSFLAGIPARCGYNRKWGFLLNRTTEDKKHLGSMHETEYNLELLKTIGISTGSQPLNFLLDIRDDDFSDKRLVHRGLSSKNFIIIHPWASNTQKEWPLDKFKAVALQIMNTLHIPCVLIGGPEEVKRADQFCNDMPLINLTGKTSLIELAGLLKKGRVLLTNDSGPMHLAAAVGIPIVAIFRKQPPAISARRWGPVGTSNSIIENDVLAEISVEEVFHGVKTILSR
ncbi:MAG: hypothetical protein A2Y00_02995 [Omnitrophica WOR_2 bacterium GWF2_43_52]|nr:MAG: hypothetical protein A2Y01_06390 [Omnitrophica WOR_2 bacterium GWC2_44_8]OGX22402.1 MAG: hypothetical protein A2Y00_02995 [Omnitrophica WOR_2 bacterium GWF2_43_52]OGX57853.1 MAG: hypothetical protein A2460_05145 [Omnitrophica WOR_2 bacterium RIFOXYC2_FULL_43_9]HAH20819.1 hypothetical protein [Candidatus Omnitrophota bacterium]HBG64487.1 hypothetical protein [Candidatus Omnitrophota bacterium]